MNLSAQLGATKVFFYSRKKKNIGIKILAVGALSVYLLLFYSSDWEIMHYFIVFVGLVSNVPIIRRGFGSVCGYISWDWGCLHFGRFVFQAPQIYCIPQGLHCTHHLLWGSQFQLIIGLRASSIALAIIKH